MFKNANINKPGNGEDESKKIFGVAGFFTNVESATTTGRQNVRQNTNVESANY